MILCQFEAWHYMIIWIQQNTKMKEDFIQKWIQFMKQSFPPPFVFFFPSSNESGIQKLIPSMRESRDTPVCTFRALETIVLAWMCIFSQFGELCYIEQMNGFCHCWRRTSLKLGIVRAETKRKNNQFARTSLRTKIKQLVRNQPRSRTQETYRGSINLIYIHTDFLKPLFKCANQRLHKNQNKEITSFSQEPSSPLFLSISR